MESLTKKGSRYLPFICIGLKILTKAPNTTELIKSQNLWSNLWIFTVFIGLFCFNSVLFLDLVQFVTRLYFIVTKKGVHLFAPPPHRTPHLEKWWPPFKVIRSFCTKPSLICHLVNNIVYGILIFWKKCRKSRKRTQFSSLAQ